MVWEVCTGVREIANKHRASITVDANLRAWARKEKRRVDSIPDVQSVERQPLPILAENAPVAYAAINNRPFQTVGAKFITTNRVALIADDPGLGKTLQTIAAMIEADVSGPILVVGPKAAVGITWPNQARQWGTQYDQTFVIDADMSPLERHMQLSRALEWGNASVFNVGEAAEGKSGFKNRRAWICVSPNYLRLRTVVDPDTGRQIMNKGHKVIQHVNETIPALFDVEWSAIIVDEAHKTLAGATGNVRKQSAQRQGLGSLKVVRNGYRIALSGTPFRGKPENLWGILQWLEPQKYRSYWKWIDQFFDIENDFFGTTIGQIKSESKFYESVRSVMLRRTKREVAPDMPPKLYGGEHLDPIRQPPLALLAEGCEDELDKWYEDNPPEKNNPIAVWLPMISAQKRQYASMKKDAVAKLKGGNVLMANGTFAELTRTRQLACSAGRIDDEEFYPSLPSNKFDWIVEFLDERGMDSKADRRTPKVLISSAFTKLLDLFAEELFKKYKIKSHVFTGKTSMKKRKLIEDDWQNNPDSDTRILFINMESGGTSLSLDAFADDVITLNEPWAEDDEEQLTDRIHRLSRIHQVTVWRLRSRDSAEEGIARNTTGNDHDIKSIMDGARGVDFALKILE